MKRSLVILLAAAALFLAACGEKKNTTADGKEWKEMDDFHMIMAETFHPYKDSADLAPTKAKVRELVASADKWSNSGLPEKVNNDEMKVRLQELKSETEALADIVQTGTDKEIGDQLTVVHDKFHEIQEAWYGGHGHEH